MPLDAIGGGLTSRIIYIYEEEMGKMVFLPMETAEEAELRILLLHDLDKINRMSGQFKYTEAFMSAWTDWRIQDKENPPFHDERFGGYISRRPTHVMKLSMVMSASDGDRDQMVLVESDLKRAVETIEKAELKMQNVFGGVGKSDTSELLHRVLMFVKTSATSEIPVYQLARHFRGDMDKFTMDRVLHTMEAMNVAVLVSKPQADDYIKILDRDACV